jgi:hypothetical protein
VAFGSLIIAIVQFIRLVLAYLDRKTKGLQVGAAGVCGAGWLEWNPGSDWRGGAVGRVCACQSASNALSSVFPHPLGVFLQQRSKIWKAVFCCIQCCMWCFEKCLKFIT